MANPPETLTLEQVRQRNSNPPPTLTLEQVRGMRKPPETLTLEQVRGMRKPPETLTLEQVQSQSTTPLPIDGGEMPTQASPLRTLLGRQDTEAYTPNIRKPLFKPQPIVSDREYYGKLLGEGYSEREAKKIVSVPPEQRLPEFTRKHQERVETFIHNTLTSIPFISVGYRKLRQLNPETLYLTEQAEKRNQTEKIGGNFLGMGITLAVTKGFGLGAIPALQKATTITQMGKVGGELGLYGLTNELSNQIVENKYQLKPLLKVTGTDFLFGSVFPIATNSFASVFKTPAGKVGQLIINKIIKRASTIPPEQLTKEVAQKIIKEETTPQQIKENVKFIQDEQGFSRLETTPPFAEKEVKLTARQRGYLPGDEVSVLEREKDFEHLSSRQFNEKWGDINTPEINRVSGKSTVSEDLTADKKLKSPSGKGQEMTVLPSGLVQWGAEGRYFKVNVNNKRIWEMSPDGKSIKREIVEYPDPRGENLSPVNRWMRQRILTTLSQQTKKGFIITEGGAKLYIVNESPVPRTVFRNGKWVEAGEGIPSGVKPEPTTTLTGYRTKPSTTLHAMGKWGFQRFPKTSQELPAVKPERVINYLPTSNKPKGTSGVGRYNPATGTWSYPIREAPKTKLQEVGSVIGGLFNVPRNLAYGGDLSFLGAQGARIATGYPKEYAEAIVPMLEYGFERGDIYEKSMANLVKNNWEQWLIKKGHYLLRDVGEGHPTEEWFMAQKILEETPFLKYLTRGYSKFSRKTYTGFMNEAIDPVLKRFYDKGAEKGLLEDEFFEESVYKGLSALSGRGTKGGKAWQANIEWLTKVFGAPSYIRSQIEMINPFFYVKNPLKHGFGMNLHPIVAAHLARAVATDLIMRGAIIVLAGKAGWEIGKRGTNNWGTITSPDKKKRIDVLGRSRKIITSITQVIEAKKYGYITTGTGKRLYMTPEQALLRQATTMYQPLISAGMTMIPVRDKTGKKVYKDYMGKPTTLGKQALGLITPISAPTIYDLYKDGTTLNNIALMFLDITGTPVLTMEKK